MITAAQALATGFQSGNVVADATGPEMFAFRDLLRLMASGVVARVRLVHRPAPLGFGFTRLVGPLSRDLTLSRDEDDGLMSGLLTSNGVPTGTTRLADWLGENGGGLGSRYVSEIRRNFHR